MLSKLTKSYKRRLTKSRPGASSNGSVALPQGPQQDAGAIEDATSAVGIKVWRDVPNAKVDIVFVPGLGGDRDGTWTAKPMPEPWPAKLLGDVVPHARLLTWGNNAQVRGKAGNVSTNLLVDHSMNLLRDLTDDRERCNALSRTLILVAHSMGGLICKKAILLSRNNAEPLRRNIFESFVGIIFMGTPHKGSWMADWAAIPASALSIFTTTNKSLLDVLSTDNQLLEAIQTEFLAMLREQHSQGKAINVVCFFEELPIYKSMMVVKKSSATLDGYDAASIHANHSNMVKFASKDDTGFKRVSAELARWYSRLESKSESKSSRQTSRHSRRRHRSQRSAPQKTRVNGMRAGNNAAQLVNVMDGDLTVTNMVGGDGVFQSVGSGWAPITSSFPRPAELYESETSSSDTDGVTVSSSCSTIARNSMSR